MRLIFVLNFFILSICSCVLVTPELSKIKNELMNDSTKGVYLEVPFLAQGNLDCGAYSVAMALRYAGYDADPEKIKEKYFSRKAGGMFSLDLELSAKDAKARYKSGEGSFEELKKVLMKERLPAIVMVNFLPNPFPARHFALVIGFYKEKNNEWLIMHSGKKQDQIMRRDEFERIWKRSSNWMMIIFKKEGEDKIQS